MNQQPNLSLDFNQSYLPIIFLLTIWKQKKDKSLLVIEFTIWAKLPLNQHLTAWSERICSMGTSVP